MSLIRAGSISKLQPGGMMEFTAGERTIAICNVGGNLHAVDGVCPHRNGPLAQGALHGTAVVCPWHAWEFDCATGEHDYNPAIKLETFRVELSGDDILVDLA